MVRSLQTCRGIAAMLVVLFHLGGTFAQDRYFGFKAMDALFSWGDAGVEFFFVLSGFLITTLHRPDFGHPRRLGRYVWKRTLRIYPTYWLTAFAVTLAAIGFPALRQALPNDVGTYLAALTLFPLDPAVVGGTGSPILFVAWSLQYELFFYAIIAAAIVHRWAAVAIVLALVATRLACAYTGSFPFPASFLSSNLVLLFGFGVATAYATSSRLVVPRPGLVAAVAATAFVAFGLFEATYGRDPFGVDRRLVYGALASFVILGLVRAERAGTPLPIGRFSDLLGDASYALYLVHIPIISVLIKLAVATHITSAGAIVATYLAIFVACVAAALLFHRAVEKPLLAWIGRRAGTRREAAARAPVGLGEGVR